MLNFHLLLAGCGLLFLNFSPVAECAKETDISRLRATLLKNYDKGARPVLNSSDVIHVWLSFFYNGMDFDEHKGKLTLHLVTQVYWQDRHLAWDPIDYENLTEIHFGQHELWLPDLAVLNNYDESEFDHFGVTPIVAYNESSIYWLPPTKFQVGCETNFKLWPYDKQTCQVYIGSWTHDGGDVILNVDEGSEQLIYYSWWHLATRNREWALLSNSVEQISYIAYCCPEIEYVNVLITVNLERKSSAHTAAVTVVGLGIAVSILISFWLDPFANERISLMLLLIVVNSLYLQFMHQTIPNNGAVVPLTICFFRDSLILIMFAFGWTVMIRYVAKAKRNSPVSLPHFVETFANSLVAKSLCLTPRPQSKVQSQRKCAETVEDGDVAELVQDDGSNYQEDWEWLARLLDRIAFLLYFITYVIFISAFL